MNNPDRALRVGVVGCGNFGRKAYVQNVAGSPDASLTALCDMDEARAEGVAREFSDDRHPESRPTVYTDYQQMIDRESLDIVMVATLGNVRPRVVIAALKGGAHVLAAKPMAPSLAEGEEMLETAKQADRLLMIGYNFRFRDDAQVVHRFIRDGGLGKPIFARAWSQASGVPAWGLHYIKSVSGGGSLANTGIHPLDLAVWFLGSPPLLSVEGEVRSRFADLPTLPPELESIQNNYDVEDLVTGYARFANGATLSVESMWLAPPQIRNHGVNVWGTQGYASLVPLRLLTGEMVITLIRPSRSRRVSLTASAMIQVGARRLRYVTLSIASLVG